MRLEWLLHNFNVVHFVNWSSNVYNRIRSELYLSLPTIMDDANVHGSDQIPGNRLSISMGEPNVWHIEDRVLKKTFYLWNHLATDYSFNIKEWYKLETAVQDYTRSQYERIPGSYSSDSSCEDEITTNRMLTYPKTAAPRKRGKGKIRQLTFEELKAKKESKSDSDSDSGIPEVLRRSPRPYSCGQNGQHSPVNLRSSLKERDRTDDDSDDVPSLVYVSSNESSSSENTSIKSPTGYTSDEPMDDESNEIRIAGDDSIDEEGYYRRPRDVPILASSVLASLMDQRT
ncbi:hypothetical protein M407DRAFT_34966 [Tulasnella calospora MUT 4182]|uniref:Uncharacterized protein n=1 Tax=Tulasnella calospora MUT 4182 TaxID=1051891 RepID=A0A0C3L137_9AGAM|nr:hypothetical protein M407DRAFT_34966 [Tulasnella calospora MUT 4182]